MASIHSLGRLILKCCVLAAALFVGTVTSRATYSSLILIPTIDLVPKGTASIDFQNDGDVTSRHWDTHILNTQFGVTDRIEAGVDFNFSPGADSRAYGNAKYLIPFKKDCPVKFALGIANVASNQQSSPYGVACYSRQKLRLHGGAMRINGLVRPLAGLDYAATDRLTLEADWIDGIDNGSSFGASYVMSRNTSWTAGIILPNAGGGARFTVQFFLALP